MSLLTLASCSATIYRLPDVTGSAPPNFATIIIPSGLLIERIDAFRFGHCFREAAKKCAVQLSEGSYVLTVNQVHSTTSGSILSTHSGLTMSSILTNRHSSLNSTKLSVLLKNNEFFSLTSNNDSIELLKLQGKKLDEYGRDFKKIKYIDLKKDPVKILNYIVKQN